MRSQERIETTTFLRPRPRVRPLLSPREVYVLSAAPVHGLGNRGHTLWLVRDEDLSVVVEGLLRRGFLALRRDAGPARSAGPPCAEVTAEGRAALASNRSGTSS